MLTAGVIAEYNPFHNGHKYQLDQIRQTTNADYIVVAMSGNFLQRGVPAIMNKHARTQLALSQGADLVIEIPTIWATSSAEYFAKAGVTLLQNTGVVDYLGFGAECDSLTFLEKIAHILDLESETYQARLHFELKRGNSFPLARMHAIDCLLHEKALIVDAQTENLLRSPNNILAIEYLRAIHSAATTKQLKPCLIQRIGGGYHEEAISTFASATAIRKQMLASNSNSEALHSSLQTFLAQTVLSQLEDYADAYGFTDEQQLSSMLGYQLYSHYGKGYASFADCSLELSHKIQKQLPRYESFAQFCDLLKSKDITHTRLSRVLLHILLQITTEHYELGKDLGMIPYLRVLGFKKEATSLLHAMKQQATVPIITKLTKADTQLPQHALWMLEKDIFASNIYNQLILANKKSVPKNDYSQELILF